MAHFKLVPAQLPHALDLQGHLSRQSVEDCLAVAADPDTVCVDNLRTSSNVFAGVYDDKCIALAGVTCTGQVWLLTRNDLPKAKMTMARATRGYMEMLKKQHTYLYCWVRTTNTVSVKWLKWLGFKFVATHEKRLVGFEWRR